MLLQHVTTTNVYYYLAFKLIGQQHMAVAYQSLLPRLALIQPVYQHLLPHLLPAKVTDNPRPANVPKAQCCMSCLCCVTSVSVVYQKL